MCEAIELIEKFTAGASFEDFSLNQMMSAAVMHEFEIIGEASKNISEKFKAEKPAILWRKIAGMRDKIIHEYFGIDLEAVWQTVEEDIPFLKKELGCVQ